LTRLSAVVPTLGHSPWLGECLDALGGCLGGEPVERVLVVPREALADDAVARAAGRAEVVVETDGPLGFAAATNRGLAAASGPYLATVNDDAVVAAGWGSALLDALDAHPGAAAAQGVQLLPDGRVDGAGLAWNRWWQAVQVGHGLTPEGAGLGDDDTPREVFGVSATAAVYRRQALEAVALPGGPFDEDLVSYYEDVDLAVRLGATGWRALLVPAVRCRHLGSATGGRRPVERWRQVYGNRWRVLRRMLRSRFPRAVPRALARDLLDLAWAARRGDGARLVGIALGWGRALGSGRTR
jgi:GT2 family glycosyltransferase